MISIRPHPRFIREGDDLTVPVDVPLYTAMLGGEVLVPTLKGTRLALRIGPETENGQRIRLAGQGMPTDRRRARRPLRRGPDRHAEGPQRPRAELFQELAALRSS